MIYADRPRTGIKLAEPCWRGRIKGNGEQLHVHCVPMKYGGQLWLLDYHGNRVYNPLIKIRANGMRSGVATRPAQGNPVPRDLNSSDPMEERALARRPSLPRYACDSLRSYIY